MSDPDAQTSQAGFTLIEVIVSFVILAMVLGSTTLSLSYSARLGRQAGEKRLAMECAERVIAEKFRRRPGLPATETGADDGCRWRLARRLAKAEYTGSGRNLIAFKIEVLNKKGRPVEAFETYYVEAAP